MGALLNKKDDLTSSKVDNVISKYLDNTDFENVLYRPISDFTWQDASRNEINKEAIPHYSIKFAL